MSSVYIRVSSANLRIFTVIDACATFPLNGRQPSFIAIRRFLITDPATGANRIVHLK
jgi:hypothetical protein